MIRAVVLASALALVSGVTVAQPLDLRRLGDMSATISSDPWVPIGLTEAFGADDAYVFADVATDGRLDADATAVAIRCDQDRMAQIGEPAAVAGAGSDTRIRTAFAGFVALGPDGLAYASLGLARGDDRMAVRLAQAAPPRPSLVAMLAPSR